MEAERRQVTVLFADLVGFTSFSERSEEEAAKPVEVWTRQCVSRAVTFEALQVTASRPCLAPRLRWKTRRFGGVVRRSASFNGSRQQGLASKHSPTISQRC